MIRDAASERQVQAANPGTSTWLSANAGSGKTRVLTDRVARLLMQGVPPLHILCLTYTKAAASEMQNRLFDRLGSWAMMPDEDLAAELRKLGEEGPLDLPTARTLFAKAIETPGGLRIQTIHSFCAGLLRRFPLEAHISPQFKEMEEQEAANLRAQVMDELSEQAPDITAALARHITSDDTLDTLLSAITAGRQSFIKPADEPALRAFLEIQPNTSEASLLAEAFHPDDAKTLQDMAQVCANGSSTEQKISAALGPIALPFTIADIATLEGPFLYGKTAKNPFGPKIDALGTKPTRTKHPELTEALNDLMERIAQARPKRLALATLTRTLDLHAFAHRFTESYEAHKLARGLLDFDDLISKASSLLNAPDVAQWVLYRLDGGIDHILVDEAQDTSPQQWNVIRSLAQEFSTGEGAQPDRQRTIFVVGDKKQSIYSFQGADPEGFDQMRAHFQDALTQVNQPFKSDELAFSFRSAAAILNAVDATFGADHLTDTRWTHSKHSAFHTELPGRVDLWPPLLSEKPTQDDFDWTDPIDTVSEQDDAVQLAQMIAAEIKRMIREERLPVQKEGVWQRRKITEGDFLILVQGRGDKARVSLFSEIIRACKQADLKIAGADRLKVGAEMAVRDITALLRFLALPEDDLSLATALRSPLFGWTERDLYAIAQPRTGYLWTALRETTGHEHTREIIDDLLNEADFLRPYDLINRLLTRHDTRRSLLARLGPEAEDGIDALLSQALAFERSNVPSLTGFLEWMQDSALEIKRQIDSASDRIRVMTVHGAKGLEAPIVFLPDTKSKDKPRAKPLYTADGHPIWPPKADDTPPALQTLKDAHTADQEEERRRLLYVAMTRAEQWLICCAAGKTGTGQDSWHSTIAEGLEHLGTANHTFPTGEGQRFISGDWSVGKDADHSDQPAAPVEPVPPRPPLDNHPVAQPPLSPSALGGAKVMPGEAEQDDDTALARGTLVHLLLEHLPSADATARPALAQRLANSSEDTATLPDTTQIIADTLALIEAPHLAHIFDHSALTEVDLTADIPTLGRLHGAIDRLLITDTTITAIDYKSNRLVPSKPADTPDGLLRQMGAYHAMLSAIWPDKLVETAILWTATATLMPIPAALTTAALSRVTSGNVALDGPTYRA